MLRLATPHELQSGYPSTATLEVVNQTLPYPFANYGLNAEFVTRLPNTTLLMHATNCANTTFVQRTSSEVVSVWGFTFLEGQFLVPVKLCMTVHTLLL